VAVFGATRTGWYKIGWENPVGVASAAKTIMCWKTMSSPNVGWRRGGLDQSAPHQYYLFGDPVDSGGIIYPELQNVYTYLLYGDPAVGHSAVQTPPDGEIWCGSHGKRRPQDRQRPT
jgi:hypothetical protein